MATRARHDRVEPRGKRRIASAPPHPPARGADAIRAQTVHRISRRAMLMGARIIETDTTPFSRVTVDPITLDIVENALRNARNEMDAVLFRTAMSPGIREQHDAFPMIANQDGKMVVGQFGSFLYGFINGYDGTIEDGDIFITNDPYSCNGAVSHLNDWLLMMPIFHQGKLVSWAAMFGHMTDVGGKVPGSLPTDAKMIYEEGLIVPPTKIYRAGALQDDLLAILLANTRMPEWNKSDFFAIIAALRLAERRVRENIERFGADTYISRDAGHAGPQQGGDGRDHPDDHPRGDHKAHFEDWIDDDGMGNGPYKIACTLHREGEVAIFDFSGSDPQSFSSINFLLNEEMFKMFFGAFTINLFDPQILFNDGFYDLVEVRIPEGSILKPKKPAALSCRTHMLGRIFDLMGGLLGQGAPEALNAAGFSDSPHFMYSGFGPRASGTSCSRSASAVFRAGPWATARRPFAVAGLHQRAQRVPRGLFPAAHPRICHDPGQRRRGPASRRQRHHHRLRDAGSRRDLDPR
jgi:N-methylhydantoinase B